MRLRVVLLVSVGLNLAFAYVLLWPPRREQSTATEPASNAVQIDASARLVKTNVVVRRQYFTWQQIESDDYRVYIANLRSIGCPESTIRDIILAEVNALFNRRRATEIVTPEQQWWRSEPSMEISHAAAAQIEELEAERRALLTQLLGSGWEAAQETQLDRWNLPLDGTVLGSLPLQTKQAVRQIHAQSASRLQEYFQAQQQAGKTPDRTEIARIRQQTRESLAQVLNPAQLEEYLLRYSETAQNLRGETQGFNCTPDEFRAIFRARDSIEQQIQLHHSGTDSASAKRREELQRQQEAAIRQALGTERYQLYKYNQDPAFRQAHAWAQKVGAPPEAVLPMYQINQAIELERQRIRNDNSLSLEQRAAAVAQMLVQQQESLRKILGPDAYERYVRQQ